MGRELIRCSEVRCLLNLCPDVDWSNLASKRDFGRCGLVCSAISQKKGPHHESRWISISIYIGCCYCCLASFFKRNPLGLGAFLWSISLVHLVGVVRYRHGGDFCNLHADQCPDGRVGALNGTLNVVKRHSGLCIAQALKTCQQVGKLENFLLKISSTGWWFQTWLLFSIMNMGYHPSLWQTPSFFKMGTLHQQSASNINKLKKPPAHTEIGICFFGEIAIINGQTLGWSGWKMVFSWDHGICHGIPKVWLNNAGGFNCSSSLGWCRYSSGCLTVYPKNCARCWLPWCTGLSNHLNQTKQYIVLPCTLW